MLRLTIGLLLLFTQTILFGQQSYPSLLWEITGKQLKKPAYLYGTMHSQDKRIHQVADSVYLTFDASNAIALELVTDSTMDMKNVMKSMFMTDTTLHDLYTDEEYGLVKALVQKKLGVMANMLNIDKWKPLFLSSLLARGTHQKEMNLTLDMAFQQRASQQEQQLIGLETMEEQLASVDNIPLTEQASMLLDYAQRPAYMDSISLVMIDLYVANDLGGLLNLMKGDESFSGTNFNQSLVVKRNHLMAQRIDALLNRYPAFIAVGALHLPDEEGLIALLSKQGYKVRPILPTFNQTKAVSPKKKTLRNRCKERKARRKAKKNS